MTLAAEIPMKSVGPIRINGWINDELNVPLATYETPLWPSVARGAKVSRLSGGIDLVLLGDKMTRSVAFEADSAVLAHQAVEVILQREDDMKALVSQDSRFARLLECQAFQVGNIVYLRLCIQSGDASGHNMVTQAADAILSWVFSICPQCRYLSVSGNMCVDKKPSAINGLLGRGKSIIAECSISREVCEKALRTTPEALADLNLKKNWVGTHMAGAVRSANAHFANMLLATYLAFGQDAANIVEGSQGFTHIEAREDHCYFSVTLPNLIVGSVGNGKGLEFVQENLRQIGCLEDRQAGQNANRLAGVIAATVLCGELSLLAAQTNPGELMKSHLAIERQHADA